MISAVRQLTGAGRIGDNECGEVPLDWADRRGLSREVIFELIP